MGTQVYGPAVDIWGAGCIFGELLKRHPILPGNSDMDQLEKTFLLCGTPTMENWPSHRSLPLFDPATGSISSFSPIHYRSLKTRFPYTNYDVATVDFLDSLLRLDPAERPSASRALRHRYFYTDPLPAEPCTDA